MHGVNCTLSHNFCVNKHLMCIFSIHLPAMRAGSKWNFIVITNKSNASQPSKSNGNLCFPLHPFHSPVSSDQQDKFPQFRHMAARYPFGCVCDPINESLFNISLHCPGSHCAHAVINYGSFLMKLSLTQCATIVGDVSGDLYCGREYNQRCNIKIGRYNIHKFGNGYCRMMRARVFVCLDARARIAHPDSLTRRYTTKFHVCAHNSRGVWMGARTHVPERVYIFNLWKSTNKFMIAVYMEGVRCSHRVRWPNVKFSSIHRHRHHPVAPATTTPPPNIHWHRKIITLSEMIN